MLLCIFLGKFLGWKYSASQKFGHTFFIQWIFLHCILKTIYEETHMELCSKKKFETNQNMFYILNSLK